MISGAGDAAAPGPRFVLQYMVADFVQQTLKYHQVCQRFTRPFDSNRRSIFIRLNYGARPLKYPRGRLGYLTDEVPGRAALFE